MYPNDELAVLVQEATALGFDASDLMPAAVGAGTFWSGMIDWVAADGVNPKRCSRESKTAGPRASKNGE